MSEDGKPLNIKVVLLGESGVGKTSIIMRYITNLFNPRQLATQGASYVSKVIEVKKNQKIKFELWDTAGEEKYRAIARVFYQNSSVCILVYDITRKASFDEIKNFWINEIKQHLQDDASKIIFKNKINFNFLVYALVGNKSDLYLEEEVTDEEGLKLAKEINAIYQRTSAKSDSGSIDELFMNIGKKILEPDSVIESNLTKDEKKQRGKILLKQQIREEEQASKKRCCG